MLGGTLVKESSTIALKEPSTDPMMARNELVDPLVNNRYIRRYEPPPRMLTIALALLVVYLACSMRKLPLR